ncbi:SCO0607 family lipoprotein [Streptomyces sp. NPDC004111]|uniref:SCO0607 family lipoprotein n=1 Tax=Streptomyces sp. NPDC004111 TaxID=3364690 RepID=UPI00369CB75C
MRQSLRVRTPLWAAGAAALVLAATGCSMQDAICGGGEYPVLNIGSTGSACVKDGEDPPQGYTRYPEGKVPQHVDDEWAVYWQTHTVDKNGKIVDAPKD